MSTNDELREQLRQIETKVDSLLKGNSPTQPTCVEKKKKKKKSEEKRAPSAYNTFVKQTIARLRQEEEQRGDGDKMGHKEIFKTAAQSWTKEKEARAQQS
jgi:hypothetical protein